MEEGWLIIINREATREDIVISLNIALSIFAIFDNETFYIMK